MTQADFIFNAIQTVGLLTPIIILSFKLGNFQGKTIKTLEEQEKDINGIGQKISEIRNSNTEALTELKIQIDNISKTLVRVTTLMETMQEDIKALKNEQR